MKRERMERERMERERMERERMERESLFEKILYVIVESGGGTYKGLLPAFENFPPLVIFASPKTGTGLGIPLNEQFSTEAIREEIRLSNLAFGLKD